VEHKISPRTSAGFAGRKDIGHRNARRRTETLFAPPATTTDSTLVLPIETMEAETAKEFANNVSHLLVPVRERSRRLKARSSIGARSATTGRLAMVLLLIRLVKS
jgi:hypothetical protein